LNDRATALDSIQKQIDNYYADQEKLSQLNGSAQGFINILVADSSSIAEGLYPKALKVASSVDELTWQSIGLIEQVSGSAKFSELAWRHSLAEADTLPIYSMGMRGVMVAQLLQVK